MRPDKTRGNHIRHGKRPRSIDALRPANATRSRLRSSYPIHAQLPLENRRLFPRNRCRAMENDEMPHHGILPIRQHQGQCHIRRKRTAKKLPNGKTGKSKIRRPRLYAKKWAHSRYRRAAQWNTSRMGRSPNSRQLRPDTANKYKP